MGIELFVFYALAIIATASAIMVISAKNPVHSVLFLILCFFNAAGLFVLVGAEFLAMLLVVVYVGAVAVLFMFVVMMLDVNFVRLREGFLQYMPIGALIGLILLVELIMIGATWATSGMAPTPTAPVSDLTNTEQLGRVLYTEYFYLFQAAGLILLVSIIGAITLTLRERPGVRRQDIAAQVHRRPHETIELRRIKPGSGV